MLHSGSFCSGLKFSCKRTAGAKLFSKRSEITTTILLHDANERVFSNKNYASRMLRRNAFILLCNNTVARIFSKHCNFERRKHLRVCLSNHSISCRFSHPDFPKRPRNGAVLSFVKVLKHTTLSVSHENFLPRPFLFFLNPKLPAICPVSARRIPGLRKYLPGSACIVRKSGRLLQYHQQQQHTAAFSGLCRAMDAEQR